MLLAWNTQAQTPAHMHHDTTAVHGMVLFGDGPLYASHLGLYHHPHDRQIVMPVHFSNPAQAGAFTQWREQFDGLITRAPKPFPLANLNPGTGHFPFTIEVDVYAGHFERGGEKQFSAFTLLLDSPLIYRALVAEGEYAKQARFWLLSGTTSDFAVYQIGPRPDQDWILETESYSGCVAPVCEITVNKPAGPTLMLEHALPVNNAEMPLRIKKSLYQEHKDFSF